MNRTRFHMLSLGLLAVALSSGASRASGDYPGGIQTHLDAASSPQCVVCHETNAGGAGTVAKPFGQSMMSAGLVGGSNLTALNAALDTLTANGTDSDGDGNSDIDELRAGEDPSVASGEAEIPPPAFGFGCRSVSAEPTWLAFGLLVFARRWRTCHRSG